MNNEITIKCNNKPREIIYGFNLSEKEAKEFDYLGENIECHSFFRYKGEVYDLGEFIALNRDKNNCFSPDQFKGFDGYMSDSYFSGILVKFCEDSDFIVVATYFS